MLSLLLTVVTANIENPMAAINAKQHPITVKTSKLRRQHSCIIVSYFTFDDLRLGDLTFEGDWIEFCRDDSD